MSKKHSIKGKMKTPEKKMNIRMLSFLLGILLVLAGIIGMISGPDEQDWSVSDDGILSYSQTGDAEYTLGNVNGSNGSVILKAVTFKSRDSYIEGLIRVPSNSMNVPGVVVLPGAGVSKEAEKAIPELLAGLGYAPMTIDQRNLGGIDPEEDLELFRNGEEPVEYMMVHDALAAASVLGDQPEVDKDKIIMLGISNGGRFAIIATAIEPSVKGVVVISTCGYDADAIVINEDVDLVAYRFYRSIDPDNYLGGIAPRRLVMFHSLNDSIIPYEMALRTFNKAVVPKAIYPVNGSTHGYSQIMEEDLQKELEGILQ